MDNDQKQKNDLGDSYKKRKVKKTAPKTNGFALLLYALVIVTAAPMDSMPTLTYVGLLVGLIGLILVCFPTPNDFN